VQPSGATPSAAGPLARALPSIVEQDVGRAERPANLGKRRRGELWLGAVGREGQRLAPVRLDFARKGSQPVCFEGDLGDIRACGERQRAGPADPVRGADDDGGLSSQSRIRFPLD
jgi:hypothetical protein